MSISSKVLSLLLALFWAGTASAQVVTGGGSGGGGTATNGVGGSANPGSPVMGWYLGNVCPAANTGQCFFTASNTQQDNNCTWSSVSVTVTCTDGPFKAGDATKQVMGFQTCQADLGSGNNAAISYNGSVQIAAFVSATQVTLSATPINSTSGAGCFIWGTLDDTNTATFDAAIVAAPTCPKLFLMGAQYYWQSPHFFTIPTACPIQGPGNGAFGTTSLPYGPELEGRGVGPTTIFLDTSFPNGDACTHKQGGGAIDGACFTVWLMGKWSDFSFSGGGQYSASGTNMANKVLMSSVVGTVQNFTCTNFHPYDTTVIGLDLESLSRLYQYNNAGCGGIGIETNGTQGQSEGYRVVVENSTTALELNTTQKFTCFACLLTGPVGPTSTNNVIFNNAGGYLAMYGGTVAESTNGTNTNDTEFGYRANGGTGYFDGVDFKNFNIGGASNFNSSTFCGVAGSIFYFIRDTFSAQSSGAAYSDNGNACLAYDLGGNASSLYTAGLGVKLTGTGTLFAGEANSASAVPVTAAKLVLSAGWGASAANTALTGGDFPIQFTITNTGAGQGASPTITYTFPTPLGVAPFSCTAVDLSGTNPLLNPFTTSSLTKTGAVFTATGTPTVADTEVMQITCVTP